MQIFVEANPRYADAYSIDDDAEPEEEAVLLEDGEGILAAHLLAPAPLEGCVHFVDGVRRTDFRVHDLLPSGMVVRGLAGSFGVGAVRCRPRSRPVFVEEGVERRLLWTHGHAAVLPPADGWTWPAEGLASTDREAVASAVEARDAAAAAVAGAE